mgnify:CR=1 FL=1
MNFAPQVEMPLMIKAELGFKHGQKTDIKETITKGLHKKKEKGLLKKGMNVAVAVGSREISEIGSIVESIANYLKDIGCMPKIIPAMGSHGNANAQYQKEILLSYGVSEERCCAEIHASMETKIIGEYQNHPIHMDAYAAQSDAIVAVNRVKPHTDFYGKIESGICKMLAVGLGKHSGALVVHDFGPQKFSTVIPGMAEQIIRTMPLIIGVAVIEDAFHSVADIQVMHGEEILPGEERCLRKARKLMPKLPFDEIDVLIVDEAGKNISGSSMDKYYREKLFSVE